MGEPHGIISHVSLIYTSTPYSSHAHPYVKKEREKERRKRKEGIRRSGRKGRREKVGALGAHQNLEEAIFGFENLVS